MKSRRTFKGWLNLKGLADRTIKEYLRYYEDFYGEEYFTQTNVDQWLTHNNNPVARAFLKNLKSYIVRHHQSNSVRQRAKTVEIERVTGRGKRELPKILTRKEVELLSKSIDDERTQLMILTTFYCGIRRQGLLDMIVQDFDWVNYEEGQPIRLTVKEKQSKERIVFVPWDLAVRINRYIRKKRLGYEDKVWGIGRSWWAKQLNKASFNAFNKRMNPHTLRHSFATHLINNGATLEEVKELLGHENINTTMIYAHLDKSRIQKKYSKIMNS